MSNFKDTALDKLVAEIRDTANAARNKDNVKATPMYFRTRATRQVTDRAQEPTLQRINQYECKSIRALMAWTANEQQAAPETVEAITEVRFGVQHVTDLQRKDYEDVVRFLIDLRIDEMKN